MTKLEILNKHIDFSKDGVIDREDALKAMQEYADQQLSIQGVVHSAYLCKDVNGEDCMVVAENIADVFDKLEKITPCPDDVTVSGKSTRVYY